VPDRLVISKLKVDSAMTEPVTVVNNNPIIIAITHVVLCFIFTLFASPFQPSYDTRHAFKLFQTTQKTFNVNKLILLSTQCKQRIRR
jgi:hypothetical protein